MRRFRFSIASLLGLVVFVAVGLAALHAATDEWDGGVLALVLLALLTSVLLAVHRTERERAFWLGFALFGSIYLTASLVPTIEPRLPSTRGLRYLDSKLSDRVVGLLFDWSAVAPSGTPSGGGPSQAFTFTASGTTLAAASGPTAVRLWNTSGKPLLGSSGSTENFVRIGHSLLAFMMALVGGHLSRFFYDRPGRRGADEPEAPPRAAPILEPTTSS